MKAIRIPPYKIDSKGYYYESKEGERFRPIDFDRGKTVVLNHFLVLERQNRREWLEEKRKKELLIAKRSPWYAMGRYTGKKRRIASQNRG